MTAKDIVLMKYSDAVLKICHLLTYPSQNEYTIICDSVSIPAKNSLGYGNNIIGYSRISEAEAWENAVKNIFSQTK